MKLIAKITIENFRSIGNASLQELGDFTALAGLNNSGKSNVLRALNAFFTSQTDRETPLSLDTDYFRPNLKKKRGRRIRISIRFSLPPGFRFRKGLEAVQQLLSSGTFEITKEWDRSEPAPRYYLNQTEVDLEQRPKIDQFLSLISFRYIPNRVLPLDVIRREHQSLRDVLVRRLSRRSIDDQEAFDALRTKSAELLRHLSRHVRGACSDISEVRLATPSSWREMVFAFGYKLLSNDIESDDVAQGSGVQSLLMFETLSLIDRDYFQRFGWRQASVWAVEEPESSLHSSLEARVASFLADISADEASRLQVIATTHSDIMIQYADRAIFVIKKQAATAFSQQPDKRKTLEQTAKEGISRWVHPILANPLDPIVLVEGKSDQRFMQQALQLADPRVRIVVSYPEELQEGPTTGGVEELLKYIKANQSALRTRVAPAIIVIDWDSASKKPEFEKYLVKVPFCKVLVWSASTFNPELSETFRGLERHLSNRIINAADNGAIATKPDGIKIISGDELGSFKKRVLQALDAGIQVEDLEHSRPFIDEILKVTRDMSG
jgi:energy-coupling factor transporter ATP-binding protein EcfA2